MITMTGKWTNKSECFSLHLRKEDQEAKTVMDAIINIPTLHSWMSLREIAHWRMELYKGIIKTSQPCLILPVQHVSTIIGEKQTQLNFVSCVDVNRLRANFDYVEGLVMAYESSDPNKLRLIEKPDPKHLYVFYEPGTPT